jgi:hypothetical protein
MISQLRTRSGISYHPDRSPVRSHYSVRTRWSRPIEVPRLVEGSRPMIERDRPDRRRPPARPGRRRAFSPKDQGPAKADGHTRHRPHPDALLAGGVH